MDVLAIEFYGQGEVAHLADRVDEQMRLIDENLDHSSADAAIARLDRDLEDGEKRLIDLCHTLENLRAEAATRPRLETRRDRLSESLAHPVFAERSRWDRERTWINGRQDWLKDIITRLPVSIPPLPEVSVDTATSPVKSVLGNIDDTANRILQEGSTDLASLHAKIGQATSEIDDHRIEWEVALQASERQFRARLAEIGAEDLAQAAAELQSVNRDLIRLEATIEPNIAKAESDLSSLQILRAQQLRDLKAARSKKACARSDFVEDLNTRLGGNVEIDLSAQNKAEYFRSIDVPLQGSGMLHREKQISLVCGAFTADEFVNIVRSGSNQGLTAKGVTENNSNRIIKTLTDDSLFKIERVDIPQSPSIRIKREGADEFTDLSLLSVGEKCSAILSIALVSKGKPLVIDQPEDDLDHAFIINSIVEGMRTAKSDRQIIAATHNPNIPVLGDAEMVFRVARLAGDDVCRIQNSGGLELPSVTEEVQSLEGGAEAFERRRLRYSASS